VRPPILSVSFYAAFRAVHSPLTYVQADEVEQDRVCDQRTRSLPEQIVPLGVESRFQFGRERSLGPTANTPFEDYRKQRPPRGGLSRSRFWDDQTAEGTVRAFFALR
jgi:hypothetical protein